MLQDVFPLWFGHEFAMTQSKTNNEPGSPIRRVSELLLDLLRRPEQLRSLVGQAVWTALHWCTFGQCRVDYRALFKVGMSHMHAAGPASEWTSVSREKRRSGTALPAFLLNCVIEPLSNSLPAEMEQEVRQEFISSGLFGVLIEGLRAVGERGVEKLKTDTSPHVLQYFLSGLKWFKGEPECEAKIRSLAPTLAMCMEHPLEYMPSLGLDTGQAAALLCAAVFGRDEEDSELSFTQVRNAISFAMILKVINLPRQARDKHRKSTQKRCVFLQENVDSMLMSWEERMRPVGWGRVAALSQGVMLVLELTISDARKPLLLANPGYVPYLVDSLLLDPKHP
jgi:hypothetical protein